MKSIPDDLWSLVAEEMYNNGDMKSLQTMCLVSDGFSRIAVPWLYRSIVFNMREQKVSDLAATILNKDRGRYIHAIFVTEWAAAPYMHLITEIFKLLPTLSALEHFSWRFASQYWRPRKRRSLDHVSRSNSPQPLDLADPQGLMMMLDGMTGLSKLELRYVIGDDGEQQIISPSCKNVAFLARLDLHWSSMFDPGQEQLEQCKALVGAATNLQILKLSMDTSNAPYGSPPVLYFEENEHIPQITNLILDEFSYSFGHPGKLELEHRLQVSALRTLSIRLGGYEDLERFLETIMDRGPICLKVFEISMVHDGFYDNSEFLSILSRFLLHFKGLERLRCGGHLAPTFCNMHAAICNHRETLLALSLIEQDRFPDRKPSEGMYLRDLGIISEACPRLQELEFDVVSGGTLAYMDMVWRDDWKLPDLKSLKIDVSVNHDEIDSFRSEYMKRLAVRLCNQCPRLQRLIMILGDSDERGKRSRRAIWRAKLSDINGKNTPMNFEKSPYENIPWPRRPIPTPGKSFSDIFLTEQEMEKATRHSRRDFGTIYLQGVQ